MNNPRSKAMSGIESADGLGGGAQILTRYDLEQKRDRAVEDLTRAKRAAALMK